MSPEEAHRGPLPLVAIVGRPNVGKSRLFNRFTGAGRALVNDVPGVTRDRIASEVEVAGRRILLVDTAGLDPEAEADGDLSSAVQAQARAAVASADAILFVLDGKAGLLPDDEEIARTLRQARVPLVTAVNKIDDLSHDVRVAEFHALGFDLHAISAEHGHGAFDALEALVGALPSERERPAADEEPGLIRIAVAGRPNVGKSSLVNKLLGEERVVVSSVPGTTRDSVDVMLESEGHRYVLVDTAGLRRPGRRTERLERGSALMTVRALERADVALLLVDAAEGFTDQDAHVARLVRERGCACVVLANKWDQVEAKAADDDGVKERTAEGIAHGLRFMSDAPIQNISALTGSRLRRVLPLVRRVAESARKRISTAELNRWLEETVRRHEPSMARRSGHARRPIKFFYATQADVRPPTFVLFCTEPHAVATQYRRYLENRLREQFGFAGSPVRFRLRARRGGDN